METTMATSTEINFLNLTTATTTVAAEIVNLTISNASNTLLNPSGPPTLKKVHDFLITSLLLIVMFAMGCSITLEQVLSHLRRPIGVLTGMVSQFFLLPFSAYCLVKFLTIEPLHAAGLLILASSPGGVTSNIFTVFCDGDISLSVTMTTLSTIVALLMMPFNVWLYGSSLENGSIVIPYGKMAMSLCFLTAPVGLGMLVLWKFPKVAPILTKIGSVAGFLIIIVCETLEVLIFPNIFKGVPFQLYLAELLLPLLGLGLGFSLASVFRLKHPIRRTIAIESGIQNVGTALAIVSLSYPFEQLRKVWLFPFLYAFSMLGICIIVAIIYQLHKRFSGKKFEIWEENEIQYTEKPKISIGNEIHSPLLKEGSKFTKVVTTVPQKKV